MQFVLFGVIILLLLFGLFFTVRLISFAARGVGVGLGDFIEHILFPAVVWGTAAWLITVFMQNGAFV